MQNTQELQLSRTLNELDILNLKFFPYEIRITAFATVNINCALLNYE